MRMKPRPTLDMAYSFVHLEEQQKEISTMTNEGTTLMAHQSSRRDQYSKGKKHTKKIGKQKRCENCKKRGHTMVDCLHMKGFPSNHPLHGNFPKYDGERTEKSYEKLLPRVTM